MLESLYSEGLTFAEIDKRFLIKLVLNYSVHEITKKLEIGKDFVYTLIRTILGFNNVKQARAELTSKVSIIEGKCNKTKEINILPVTIIGE